MICTSEIVLGTQRQRAKGVRAGGVVYIEAADGTLSPLTARDVRSPVERVVRSPHAPCASPPPHVSCVRRRLTCALARSALR
jgi:hypothetical protein